MKASFSTFVAVVAVCLAGCASTPRFAPQYLGMVNLGMSKEEVLSLLGPPRDAGVSEMAINNAGDMRKREVLRYASGTARSPQYYVIIFSDAKVEDYGPQVGRLDLEGVFTPYPASNGN